jgi:hypothetical protein
MSTYSCDQCGREHPARRSVIAELGIWPFSTVYTFCCIAHKKMFFRQRNNS